MNTLTASARPRFPRFADAPDTYTALCSLHLPRPIHNAAEARAAAAVVESLAGFPLNRDQADYLEAVAHFVDEYDRAHKEPCPPPTARPCSGISWTNTACTPPTCRACWAAAATWAR